MQKKKIILSKHLKKLKGKKWNLDKNTKKNIIL